MNAALVNAGFTPWRKLPANVRARLLAVRIHRENSRENQAVKRALKAVHEEQERKRIERARIAAGVLALRRKENAA